MLFEDSISDQEALIFRCHCAMADPDGIYGVTHGNDISTLAKVYAHGGQWSKAAAAFDSVLNVWTDVGGQEDSHGIFNSSLNKQRHLNRVHEQLATSIHEQGLHSLLTTFMRGHQSSPHDAGLGEESGWVTDRTLEALWRTTQWERPEVVSRLQLPSRTVARSSDTPEVMGV